jgi:NitT/TauT family transport system ATP-binding protein
MEIELSTLSFFYPNSPHVSIIDELTFRIKDAKVVCFVGPSGCGKTTLLKIIGGLLEPSSGTVSINGVEANVLRKEGGVAFCFQNPALFPWKNVRDNIALPFIVQKQRPRWDYIEHWLKRVGLGGWENMKPHQLSGGMQQRVALARALINGSKLLLLDEPFAKLDEVLKYELYSYVEEYILQNAATLCFVTHDIAEAVQLSDHVIVFGRSPLRTLKEHMIPFRRPRMIDLMSQPAFAELTGQVRNSLFSQIQNE